MANLIGHIHSDRSHASRLSSRHITAQLETWDGSIRVDLDKDGNASVQVGEKGLPRLLVWRGNIDQKGA